MARLFHRTAVLSMWLGLVTGAAFAGLPAGAADVGAASPFYGRWTVAEDRPAFTARGRQYKTIDIAPCGRDFCGVSVADSGACGPTLFRFLAVHNDGESVLHGHGRWGQARKNVQISSYGYGDGNEHRFELYLGDGYDFGDRSDNMPTFHAEYRRTARAGCRAR